ncbi:MAG: YezD family protein [Treponema sp.]|nr:YezD family protein [Treponema sp.]
MAQAEGYAFHVIKKGGKAEEDEAALEQIAQAVRGIRFGSVTVHVEDGKVVQIDTLEKRRLR